VLLYGERKRDEGLKVGEGVGYGWDEVGYCMDMQTRR